MKRLVAALYLILGAISAPVAAESVLVELDSPMRYLANVSDPGIAMTWTAPGFDDTGWPSGTYGVGYETGAGAGALLRTVVSSDSHSVYTRAAFTIADVSKVHDLFLGADYDDGYVVWINDVEVFRSPEMPISALTWSSRPVSHESSNGVVPGYDPLHDITNAALPALHDGVNVLSIGVWNTLLPSSDLVLVPRLSINRPVALTRAPYLQSGTQESVVVRWRTDVPTESRVTYGDAPGNLFFSADDPTATTEHVVKVSGLLPGASYYYAVGFDTQVLAGDDLTHHFATAPPPGARTPTRVWVIGDSGTANADARAVRDAYRTFSAGGPADLWLMLGDNAYPDGTDSEYQAAVFDMYPDSLASMVLWPTLGNHDGHTADSATQSGPYYDIFTLPKAGEAGGMPSGTEAYYSFDYGNIHFICLESHETDRSPGGAMMTWLREDAMSTTKEWIIAFWHHPPYSKGSHDSDTEAQLIEMREAALPILEQAGVDLVLTGHSHSYERSFLLDGHYGLSSSLAPSMIKDHGDGREEGAGAYTKPAVQPVPHEGAVYVVAGSSGQAGGGPLNHPAMYLSLNTLGSLVLDVNGDRLDASFLNASGVVRDHFSIIKQAPNTPPIPVPRTNPRTECTSAEGATVTLDGSGSQDADSSPGTSDDIALFEWLEHFGEPTQTLLGTGSVLEPTLSLGLHAITLRVTDRQGASATAVVDLAVVDTTPPRLTVDVAPAMLWPPNHRMVDVNASVLVYDTCGASAFQLVSVTSNGPDGGRHGQGGSDDDIQGVEPETADVAFALRAERNGGGPARVYTAVYRATDASGNAVTATSGIIVPHGMKRAARALTVSDR